MAVSAYVLIQTELGKAARRRSHRRRHSGGGVLRRGNRSLRCDRSGRGRLARRAGQAGRQPLSDDRGDHPHAHLRGRPPGLSCDRTGVSGPPRRRAARAISSAGIPIPTGHRSVSCPGAGVGVGDPGTVRLKRGAGAGWTMPPTSMKVPAAFTCGMVGRLAGIQHGGEAGVAPFETVAPLLAGCWVLASKRPPAVS